MPDEKLTEKDKADMQKALKESALTDLNIQKMAEGEDEFGDTSIPIKSGDDLISAAATALEFVEGLDSTEGRAAKITQGTEAVANFDALLKKLESMRSDITALQRTVVGIFAAQLLTFRGKVVDLKTIISDEMVEKLRMPMFKGVIETTFVDIVDGEFASLEKELVDRIVDETQEKFKDFATRVRETETNLRATIIQQQDVVRSFMQSLEEDALASGDVLTEKDKEIRDLQEKMQSLHAQINEARSQDVAREELNRRIADLESEISEMRENLFRKDAVIEERTKERDDVKSELEEQRIQTAEIKTELEVYKKAESHKKAPAPANEAELKALKSKVDLLEKTLAERRQESETNAKTIKTLERELAEKTKEKDTAEELSVKRLKEIEAVQDKINEIKEFEQKIYDLEQELKEANEKIPIVEMQREAYEKATRLMEKERDMALEMRDLADERTKRYITVLGLEANTKVLLLVDEVGKMSFADLGKALGIPAGLAQKHARELSKLGVIKLEGDLAVSTLKEIEIKEGEVKLD
ncbi:MAG: hypothetical protein ACFFEF_03620 [Candidatus Thorarchaeota archaeon]